MWGSSATLCKPPYVTLPLTFRFPLRGGLRSLTWLTFRWLTFSIIYSTCIHQFCFSAGIWRKFRRNSGGISDQLLLLGGAPAPPDPPGKTRGAGPPPDPPTRLKNGGRRTSKFRKRPKTKKTENRCISAAKMLMHAFVREFVREFVRKSVRKCSSKICPYYKFGRKFVRKSFRKIHP